MDVLSAALIIITLMVIRILVPAATLLLLGTWVNRRTAY